MIEHEPDACLRFFVPGRPVPKGDQSTDPKTGRHYWKNHKQLDPWTEAIATHAAVATAGERPWTDGWVYVQMLFVLRRPKSNRNPYPKKPDGDKLDRAVFDALSGLVYTDDEMVADHDVKKRWDDSGHWGEPGSVSKPGVLITVWRM